MKEENTALGAQLASHEGKEAVAAFIEKRRPNFDLGSIISIHYRGTDVQLIFDV